MSQCPSCAAAVEDDARFCARCGSALAATTPLGPRGTERDPNVAPPPAGATSEGRFVPGTLLAKRYRIVSLLGRGGMGEVYRADDTKLGQTVALKFLPASLATDAVALERFFAEVRIGRQVAHPNVCRLYDLVEVEGHHCLSMEFVDGEDLASLLKRIGRLPADKAIDIAREVCAGLAAAHDKGVIHRDLKPANVMIDGKGRARITDFGVAALAEDAEREGFAGTPAYMAPEQLAGKPASVRSDVYALGLLLAETFTGKRVFDAPSLDALKALHERTEPPSLTSGASDVPTEIQLLVTRCLAREPAARPASAHAVLAGLPGGDPLQAALAAGETPTPAMVAAAGAVGDLGAGVAWGVLVAGILGLTLVMALAGSATFIGCAQPDLAPDTLIEKSRALLKRLDYADHPLDSAGLFDRDDDYVRHVAANDPSPARWETIGATRPGVFHYVYRESPSKLIAREPTIRPFQPSEIGRITRTDPPMTLPGMREVVLDQHGYLVSMRAIPPDTFDPAVAPPEPDWTPALAATGLDPAKLVPSTPRHTAPFAADRRAAWDGAYPGREDVPVHIEAAAFRGRIDWLQVQAPWTVRDEPVLPGAGLRAGMWIVLFASIAAGFAITAMVRRNLRLGRGDNVGAKRLANTILWTTTIALVFRADHVTAAFEETATLVMIMTQTVFFAFMSWMFYVALEPSARRRWPTLLISWSRLLAGRALDPMVGRDVLIGAVAGIGLLLLVYVSCLAPRWLGLPPKVPHIAVISTLSSARHVPYFFLTAPCLGALLAIGALFSIMLNRAIVRVDAIALLLTFSVLFFVMTLSTEDPGQLGPTAAVFTVVWLVVLLRVGVLAAAVAMTVETILDALPLSSDPTLWYAARGYIGLVFVALVLAGAFFVALGGKPLFGRGLLDES